jgi:transcriptional regulator GlxA family with amidase domain
LQANFGWPLFDRSVILPSFSVISGRSTMSKTRRVAMVLFPDALALDVAGPAEVFAAANHLLPPAKMNHTRTQQIPASACHSFSRAQVAADGVPRYAITFLSPRGKAVRTASGMLVKTQPLDSVEPDALDTLIVSGGVNIASAAANSQLITWIRAASRSARRTCSVCTGAFVLAATGLLDGRRATTHWGNAADFRAHFPRVRLDIEPIYVRDGRFWTSAGVTAGIDLALALVQEDCGRRIAVATARQLVVFMQRPGGQAQFSSLLRTQAQNAERDEEIKLGEIENWIAEHLDDDLSVERLAERYRMSVRTFARHFVRRTGMSPAKAVEMMRIEAARRQLEETAHAVKRVAADCGFGDEERMRRAFRRHLAVSPSDYRARFASR